MRITFLIVSLLSHSVSTVAAECDLTLNQVLDRYLEARGGHEALNRQRALRIRSSYHEGDSNPQFDFRVMKPGYMRIRAVYDDGYVFEEGFDGERGWEKPDGEPASYIGGDANRAVNQAAYSPVHLYSLTDMEGLGARVELKGCEVIDDREYFVINVVSTFGTDIDYYISSLDYTMERARSVRPLHPTNDPTPITIEERWADFRLVNGVLHSFSSSQWNVDSGEQLSSMEVESIEFDHAATPESFAKPAN